MSGAGRGGRPSRPTEKGRKFANRFGLTNRIRAEAELRSWIAEERCIIGPALLEGPGLRIGIRQRSSRFVISVRLEVLNRACCRGICVRFAIELDAGECSAMKVLRGEILPKISAVTKNRSVFHQSVSEKDSLASHDVGAREQGRSFGVFYDLRNGRLIGIGVVRKDTHNEKADNQDDACRLDPTVGDHERPFAWNLH